MSVEIVITRASEADVRLFVPLARPDHHAEVEALGGASLALVLKTFAMSNGAAWAVTFDGEPAVLFGVIPCSLITGFGSPWVLTTPVIERHKKTFFKLSRQIVPWMRATYPVLGSSIHVDFAKSLRWVRRLGFTVKEPRPCGARGALFHPVIMGGV